MDRLNLILKNTLHPRIPDEEYPDIYVDYLNIACLLAGLRNGIHLDTIQNEELMYNLTNELKLLGYDSNTRFETTIWNTSKITNEQVLHSWAFEGDVKNMNNPDYWANNALLLGNDLGYPTFTTDPLKKGSWSLNLRLNCNRNCSYPISMMGGCYDKMKQDDLRSIKNIKVFLEPLIGHSLYNPNGDIVYLEKVELDVT
jgi:hypothetical protein